MAVLLTGHLCCMTGLDMHVIELETIASQSACVWQVREDSCYAHALGVLRDMYGQPGSGMTAREQLTYRTLLLQAGPSTLPFYYNTLLWQIGMQMSSNGPFYYNTLLWQIGMQMSPNGPCISCSYPASSC